MNQIITRHPYDNEIPILRNMWSTVFGSVGIDPFFKLFFDKSHCIISSVQGVPAAMGYLLPAGNIDFEANTAKCAMIYSIAALPDYRGLGLGTAVVKNLINLACKLGYDAVVLCPSDDELFEYYGARTELCDWFYVNEKIFTQASVSKNIKALTKVSASEYQSFRKKLLSGILHIDNDLRIFEYQSALCSESGGGMFLIDDCCAVVERQSDDEVWVKELLMPDLYADSHVSYAMQKDIAASIAAKFPADKYIIRMPAQIDSGRRFGMAIFFDGSKNTSKTALAPWYGMAFD